MSIDRDPEIQWGVLVALPHGANDVEEFDRRGSALMAAENINRRTPDAAKVVYRTVKYGEWSADVIGDQWGVRETWIDGFTEIHPHNSRSAAQTFSTNPKPNSTRVVVSRTVQVGDWWLAEVSA